MLLHLISEVYISNIEQCMSKLNILWPVHFPGSYLPISPLRYARMSFLSGRLTTGISSAAA